MTMDQARDTADRDGFLGHPRGLVYLCFAEAWERFSYFGMQALLVLYMLHHLLLPDTESRVLGFGALRAAIEGVTGPLSTAALASQVFGLYAGLAYLTPIIGGWLADRWLGRTATVSAGAILMAIGHFLMAFESAFVLALCLLLVGVGCFKGNIASQVGELYGRGDMRRSNAFLIFQNAINLAVIVSPLVCGTLAAKVGWHYGFGAAGVGMLAGLTVYLRGRRWLPRDRTRAASAGASAPGFSAREWATVALLVALLPVIAGANIGNQEMFNAYVVWGDANFALDLFGWAMPVTWLFSLDAVVAVAATLGAVAFWRWWSRRRREPDEIVKIAFGAAIMASAPLVLALASAQQAPGAKLSLAWALAFHVVNEIGFAMVFPVGLALFSRAAPARIAGTMVSGFYVLNFIANLAVGRIGGLLESMSATNFWLLHAAIAGIATLLLAVVAVFGRSLLAPTADDDVEGIGAPPPPLPAVAQLQPESS
jgi:POT family proton-dependent oligopeptide transporter